MKLTRTWTCVCPTFRDKGTEEETTMKLRMNIQEEIIPNKLNLKKSQKRIWFLFWSKWAPIAGFCTREWDNLIYSLKKLLCFTINRREKGWQNKLDARNNWKIVPIWIPPSQKWLKVFSWSRQDSEEFERNRLEIGKGVVLEAQFWTLNLRCLHNSQVKISIWCWIWEFIIQNVLRWRATLGKFAYGHC